MRSPISAHDIMTKDVVTLSESTLVTQAADTLIRDRVSSAPVVQEDFTRKILLGFVSDKDLMQCYATGRLHREPKLMVRDVMRTHPVCVRPETDLFTLAAIFMQHGFRHVPVMQAELLQGIVSRRDVLAALLVDYASWCKLDPATREIPDLGGIFTPRYLLG